MLPLMEVLSDHESSLSHSVYGDDSRITYGPFWFNVDSFEVPQGHKHTSWNARHSKCIRNENSNATFTFNGTAVILHGWHDTQNIMDVWNVAVSSDGGPMEELTLLNASLGSKIDTLNEFIFHAISLREGQHTLIVNTTNDKYLCLRRIIYTASPYTNAPSLRSLPRSVSIRDGHTPPSEKHSHIHRYLTEIIIASVIGGTVLLAVLIIAFRKGCRHRRRRNSTATSFAAVTTTGQRSFFYPHSHQDVRSDVYAPSRNSERHLGVSYIETVPDIFDTMNSRRPITPLEPPRARQMHAPSGDHYSFDSSTHLLEPHRRRSPSPMTAASHRRSDPFPFDIPFDARSNFNLRDQSSLRATLDSMQLEQAEQYMEGWYPTNQSPKTMGNLTAAITN